jgi:hypothetical protein
VPERQNLHDRRIRSYAVVEVVPDTSEKNATNAREAGIPSDRADFGMGSEYLERSGEFLTESRGCGGPVLGPPRGSSANLGRCSTSDPKFTPTGQL